ncbi:glycoside hydrolase family 9 protein [Clostridium lacusfryxellense]|uniref:glycoside hydrolase family 9 protein n=1 Tax=Clostridium lacusfryxellense TaxID=205328 RepID=UPI001C0E6093|nr:glycoside hydrolase family 9 protein [Clostridium lacusfryxellense]MBU3113333.1 glycoside hydrolase family 9 protein [Clostridium lacusfryxellense]
MVSNTKLTGEKKPWVSFIGAVSKNILEIKICEFEITGMRQVDYIPLEGDVIKMKSFSPYAVREKEINRGKERIGALVVDYNNIFITKDGSRERYYANNGEVIKVFKNKIALYSEDEEIGIIDMQDPKIFMFGDAEGQPLDMDKVTDKSCYHIKTDDKTICVKHIWRKKRPLDRDGNSPWSFSYEHSIYLELDSNLEHGKGYDILFDANINPIKFVFDEYLCRSNAIHVNQVGFLKENRPKKAYLSTWIADGGKLSYDDCCEFELIDKITRKAAYKGKITMNWPADRLEYQSEIRNHNLTDVYILDFSDFQQEGEYVIHINGIGVSYPFEIGENVWKNLFIKSMRGFYHQRSGIGLEKPYTDFFRKRSYHPDDGLIVNQSTTTLEVSGNGINAFGIAKNNFHELLEGVTDEVVEGIWGGYFDAADWDRRVQHLAATRQHLELMTICESAFQGLNFNIPESVKPLPDILYEAFWNIDFYKRAQTKEGGIRGGIEVQEHPVAGETSWQESLKAYIYAPDCWSSYIYSGVAARAAYILKSYDMQLSDEYRISSLKALEWAEKEFVSNPLYSEGKYTQEAMKNINKERNLAAIEMYRMTGEAKWHKLFVDTFGDELEDAAFVYMVLDENSKESLISSRCLRIILEDASKTMEYQKGNAFSLGALDPMMPQGNWNPFYSAPNTISCMRAYYLTKDKKYLESVLDSTLFCLGANPMNMVYTTGVGSNYTTHTLHIEARVTGQKVHEGITVCGPCRMRRGDKRFPFIPKEDVVYPSNFEDWPDVESYFEIDLPSLTEWTVDGTMAPACYAFGCLYAFGLKE